MIVNGFSVNTMKKVFNHFLNDTQTKNGQRRLLNTRTIPHKGEGNNPNLSFAEMEKENIRFQNSMALLYIKTFYGRTIENFKTIEYKMESERFNLFIKNYPNSEDLEMRIRRCLRKNDVDFVNGELPRELFYNKLQFGNIGLSTEDIDHRLFITPNFATQVRIYINPSMQDYRHILTYIIEYVAKYELEVGFKTRMKKIKTTDSLNNLILYASSKDFSAVLTILNKYGKMFPDKVNAFGDTIETLGRVENDWFGFGFEPQRSNTENMGLSTFNSAIDDIFNNYVLTASILDDFRDITENLKMQEVIRIFTETGVAENDIVAKNMALSLYDKDLTNRIINNFCNLNYVRDRSNEITKQNMSIPERKRRGLSSIQIRNDKDKPSDITLLKNQTFQYPLYSGGWMTISRNSFSRILKSSILRENMLKFYNSNDEGDKQGRQMAWLWTYIGKNLPFLDEKCPFLSDDLVKALKARMKKEHSPLSKAKKLKEKELISEKIESKEKEQIKTIKLLCSNERTLATKLVELRQLDHTDLRGLTKKQMQKKIIKTIGLDHVIDSVSYFQSQNMNSTSLYVFETALQELREERGLRLIEELKEIKTRKERERVAEELSRYAREDIVRQYQREKAMQKFDDFVRSLYY